MILGLSTPFKNINPPTVYSPPIQDDEWPLDSVEKLSGKTFIHHSVQIDGNKELIFEKSSL